MKRFEKGFTIVELSIGLALIGLIGSGAVATIFQLLSGTERSSNQTMVSSQVQNAGYWFSKDAEIAESITVDNLDPNNFIVMHWTERDYAGGGGDIEHSATYSFANLSDSVGRIKRLHWSSGGANEQSIVAQYIYYNQSDSDNTTKASYEARVLTVQVTSRLGEAEETKEYRVTRRPNF